MESIQQQTINTIRALSIDMIEEANSGHPGLPMGAAPMAYTLWVNHLNFNPNHDKFINRDRFILSAGHGSALLYSLLHLSGSLSMEELKNFRQKDSKTPGHPELHHTQGVEVTTGPLGQGFAMGVGQAMAEAHLAAKYNQGDYSVMDHYTYVLCSDGDLMEGISHESASLAGHLGLEKLIVLYDSNDISLDGELNKSFSEDIEGRFTAYGWDYIHVNDGNNIDEINRAIEQAKESDKPSLIEVKTIIGFGSPNLSGTNKIHGAPLGEEERQLTFEQYGMDSTEKFNVDDSVYEHFKETTIQRANDVESKWNEQIEQYAKDYPELYKEFMNGFNDDEDLSKDLNIESYEAGDSKATRAYSGEVLQQISAQVPQLFGGAADLASSNKSLVNDETDFSKDNYAGRNIWFGVREFGMAAALNGMASHGGIRPYGATFFVFSDYLKAAFRLSSIMKLPVTYIFTHDSIAVGEDGPTHEPIEQLAALRAIPNANVIRPAEGKETIAAWKVAIESSDKPTALILTRQNVTTLDVDQQTVEEGVRKGAYVVKEAEDKATHIIFTSGSEVNLAIDTANQLEQDGHHVQVVSVPDMARFEQQDEAYKNKILQKDVKHRIAIEMGASIGWHRFVGIDGLLFTIDQFGMSANAKDVLEHYGFTTEQIVKKIKDRL